MDHDGATALSLCNFAEKEVQAQYYEYKRICLWAGSVGLLGCVAAVAMGATTTAGAVFDSVTTMAVLAVYASRLITTARLKLLDVCASFLVKAETPLQSHIK